MEREEIVQGIERLLRQHKDGIRGSIHQDPYKSDFFRLFAAAFNAGLMESAGQSPSLRADALTDVLAARSPDLLDQETWHILNSFWSDWTYAWKHVDLLEQ